MTSNGNHGPAADRILDVAERLTQTQGFNGFSYANIARELGMTKASVHYHFPTKADLGLHLIERYTTRFLTALATIEDQIPTAPARLRAFTELYATVLAANRMCLCGMLAADFATLPEPMQAAVTRFFDASEAWLARVIAAGQAEGTLRPGIAPEATARLLIGSLEGAMLLARSFAEPDRFRDAASRLLTDLSVSPSPGD